ncbi:hypothetical protein ACWFMI_24470 [Nocardiopsis terrae]
MNDTSQTEAGSEFELGPFAPGDDERFRTNALIALVAFASLSALGVLAFVLFF